MDLIAALGQALLLTLAVGGPIGDGLIEEALPVVEWLVVEDRHLSQMRGRFLRGSSIGCVVVVQMLRKREEQLALYTCRAPTVEFARRIEELRHT